MVDESKLRDLLDGKISPDEIEDPNLIGLIERIYGVEALEKLGLRQTEGAPRMFSEPPPEDEEDEEDVNGQEVTHFEEEEAWGPRWLFLIVGAILTSALLGNVYVGFEPSLGLCDQDPCGETYTLANAPDVTSAESWREAGTLTNEDIVAIAFGSIIAVFGLTGKYKNSKR